MEFKKDFIWGAATASYQIEGAYQADGKGPSVWDMFSRNNWVKEGHTGNVACDHYHKYKDDIALMKEIGLKNYRFSISWPRIFPEGTGSINEKGLQFYKNLVDELIKNDITPFVTLFHWDYPLELFYKGGWLNADSVRWFDDYVDVVTSALGDKVKNWITFNEPQIFIGFGYNNEYNIRHAPGIKLGFPEILRISHNVMLAHGQAVKTIRKNSPGSFIGYAPCSSPAFPIDETPENIEAARKASTSVTRKSCLVDTWYMDPVFLGQYPEDGLEVFKDDMMSYSSEDLKLISQPIDFLGINTYTGNPVKAGKDGNPEQVPFEPGVPISSIRWPITPAALKYGPKFLTERYNTPIIYTENGMANYDFVHLDGKVHDPQRIDYLNRYLLALKESIDEGSNVIGYFCWSLMDNFEWEEGYRERFGLIHVDYTTLQRTIKDSGYWYGEVMKTNGASLLKP